MADITYFDEDCRIGDVGVQYYINEYLIPKGYGTHDYTDMTASHSTFDLWVRKSSPKEEFWKVEIKRNLPDTNKIVMEEYTNIRPDLGPIQLGWAMKNECDWLVSINTNSGNMVFMDMRVINPFYQKASPTASFTELYPLTTNKKITQFKNGKQARGAIRWVPYAAFPENSLWLYNKKTHPELTLIK